MKIPKQVFSVIILCLFIITSCSSDDDNSDSQPPQPTTIELLTSGKWYFESKTPGMYTSCEKKGYIQFKTNGDLILNSFDDGSGSCESLGAVTAAYTLTSNVNLTLVFGPDSQSAVINSISTNELKVSNSDTGENLVFDKTEG
ncbi:lipocalin family protein [Xanthomarina sp. GH4-25]|uniref:lipocalin family protein n=1 Tax=Xanthomarina sp. GH4-25 TaxID=3349335 RepID=UPI000D675F69|nr:hypothetical protein DI383_13915 [Flavobacteriaceae bacterium LYZ1037]